MPNTRAQYTVFIIITHHVSTQDVFSCYAIPSFDDYKPFMRLGQLLHAPQEDLSLFDKLVDTVVWEQTKDLDQAKQSARLMLEKNMVSDKVLPCLGEAKKILDAKA
jgi:hypothetical protein